MKHSINLKIGFLFLITFIPVLFLEAQTATIIWSEKTAASFNYTDAIPMSDGGFIVLKEEGAKAFTFGSPSYDPTIVRIDKNMKVITENKINIEGKSFSIKSLERLGQNIILIYHRYLKKEKSTEFIAMKINENTLAPMNEILLGSCDWNKYKSEGTAIYKRSKDSTKMLILIEAPNYMDDNKQISMAVYNTDVKPVWRKTLGLGGGSEKIKILDVDLQNEGRVFLTYKHYEKPYGPDFFEPQRTRDLPNYVYHIVNYSAEPGKGKEIDLKAEGKFIENSKFVANSDGTISIAGMYKRKFNGTFIGIFYGQLSANGEILDRPLFIDFSSSILKAVGMDGFAEGPDGKDPGLLPEFKIDHILKRSNGSIDLIAEYYQESEVRHNTGNGNVRRESRYRAGDIVVSNIDLTGKAIFTRVPKDLWVGHPMGLGYFPVIFNENLLLFYNDDGDNISRDLSQKVADLHKFNKAFFVQATIDSKGNLSRKGIVDYHEDDFMVLPDKTAKISAFKFLLNSDATKRASLRRRYGVMELK